MLKITRDVALDLWPLVEAGEASADSKALVEEFAREDSEFARIMERGKKLRALGAGAVPVLPADHEKRTLDATRRRIARRGWYQAAAIFFLAGSCSLGFSDKRGLIWFMWRDRPALAILCVLLGVLFAFLYWRSSERVGGEAS